MQDDSPEAEYYYVERNGRSQQPTLMDIALQASAREGLDAMALLYRKIEPDILRNGIVLKLIECLFLW